MKATELRRMDAPELNNELEKTRRGLLNLRCRVSMGEEVKPGEIKAARREIARILTVQRERAAAENAGGSRVEA